jgi:hypothetical protein
MFSTTPVIRRVAAASAAILVLGLAPAGASPGQGAPPTSEDPGALLSWNEIAFRTVAVEGGRPPQVAQLYLGLVSTAVYNAVVTIEGGGTATLAQPPARAHASSDVAAVTAAHDVLAHYFPASADALAADYGTWLDGVPQGVGRVHGLRVGHDAATALIASRDDSELDAPVTLPRPDVPPPGMWLPTGSGEFGTAWLAFVTPILLDPTTDFGLDGPDPLDSPEYAADYAEVLAMGSATGSDRSEADTRLGLFYTDNPPRQFQDAMRDRAERHQLDIVESARMFAAANVAGADALIACWQTKYHTNFWRPVTAIHGADLDGNPETTADPSWSPLRPAPPYPEYASGHACVSAAVATALENLYGSGKVDVDLRSAVTGDLRHYDSEQAWLDDVVDARIWLGFHFRDAMDDGRLLGNQVADQVVTAWFAPPSG